MANLVVHGGDFERTIWSHWDRTNIVFPRFMELLRYHVYRQAVLLGIVPNIGGMNQLLVSLVVQCRLQVGADNVHHHHHLYHPYHQILDSGNAFLEYTIKIVRESTMDQCSLSDLATSLVILLREHSSDDRVVVPLMKVVAQLMSHNCFSALQPPTYVSKPGHLIKLVFSRDSLSLSLQISLQS